MVAFYRGRMVLDFGGWRKWKWRWEVDWNMGSLQMMRWNGHEIEMGEGSAEDVEVRNGCLAIEDLL